MGRSVKPRVFWLNQFLSKCFTGSRFPFQISNSEGENYKCVHLLGCICWGGNNWERSGKFWKINASCGGGGQELDQAGQPHLVVEAESLKEVLQATQWVACNCQCQRTSMRCNCIFSPSRSRWKCTGQQSWKEANFTWMQWSLNLINIF